MRTSDTRSRSALVFTVFCAFLLSARTSRATPNFPPAIQQDLSLDYQPDCSICHTDGDQGGLGTVNTPFGKNMRERGLVAFDTTSLQSALTQMENGNVDSAGDCLDDIDELKADRNPNDPDPPGVCGDAGAQTPTETPQPEALSYGCSMARAGSTIDEGWGLAFVVASLLVWRLRARRARAL
jgi:hypothetical protein